MVTLTSIFFLFLLNNNGYFDFDQFGNNIKEKKLSVIYLGARRAKTNNENDRDNGMHSKKRHTIISYNKWPK